MKENYNNLIIHQIIHQINEFLTYFSSNSSSFLSSFNSLNLNNLKIFLSKGILLKGSSCSGKTYLLKEIIKYLKLKNINYLYYNCTSFNSLSLRF